MTLLIRNGEVVTAPDRYFADGLVECGTIAAISKELGSKA